MDINDKRLDSLLTEIETVRRRRILDYSNSKDIRFIDPYHYTDKLKINNNHIILGRRGCGKTTLFLKIIESQGNQQSIIVDCQPIKNKGINSILIDIMKTIIKYLLDYYKTDLNKFHDDYKKTFGGLKAIKKYFNKNHELIVKKKNLEILKLNLELLRLKIEKIATLPEVVEISKNQEISKERKSSIQTKKDIKTKLGINSNLLSAVPEMNGIIDAIVDIELQSSMVHSTENLTSHKENITQNEKIVKLKAEYLNELKNGFADLFYEFQKQTSKSVVLYMDDFYLIDSKNQPDIIQYLHDVYKITRNSAFCFKMSALPYRIKTNPTGNYDFSFKDDFSIIRLDVDLSDFDNLKNYLFDIASNLKPELDISSGELISLFNSPQSLNYTLLAAGGIPRDFLIILSDLVNLARTENRKKITRENIYKIVNQLRQDKDQNIEYDTDIPTEIIREAVSQINSKVIDDLNTNIILYPADTAKEHESLLKNMSNLRYMHLIKENISSESRKNKTFHAYLIDMTFYPIAKRMKGDFNFREFWIKDEKHRLPHLHRAPIWNFEFDKENNKIILEYNKNLEN